MLLLLKMQSFCRFIEKEKVMKLKYLFSAIVLSMCTVASAQAAVGDVVDNVYLPMQMPRLTENGKEDILFMI